MELQLWLLAKILYVARGSTPIPVPLGPTVTECGFLAVLRDWGRW
jgi:hypothetical protein